MFTSYLKLYPKYLIIPTALVSGTFWLSQLIVALVMLLDAPDSTIQMSGIALPCVAGFTCLFASVMLVCHPFDLGVRMGMPRRTMMGYTLGQMGLVLLGCLVQIALYVWLEGAVLIPFWKALRPGLWVADFEVLGLGWVPLILVGCVLVGMAVGAIFLGFGAVMGGRIVGGLWCGICFVQAILQANLLWKIAPRLNAILHASSPWVALIAGVALVIWGFRTLLRYPVR